jgi:hypothetical protein
MKKLTQLSLAFLFLLVFTTTEAFCLTLYVDTTMGQDRFWWGRTPNTPWKTIEYAVEQINKIHIHKKITVNVAPGIYNESVTINVRPISLNGTQADTIINGGGQDALTISGVQGVTINGFTVQNANIGIVGKGAAAFTVIDTTVTDSADDGIQVGENSTAQISGCTVLRSGRDGIRLHASSSAELSGTIISNNNSRAGILISNNSDVTFSEATMETSDNGRGLWAIINSSIFFYQSTLTAKNNKDNNGQGVKIGDSSSLFLVRESEILSEGNSDDGLEIWGSSRFNLSSDSTLTVRNNGDKGLKVAEGSSGYFAGDTIVENNGHYGISLEPHSSAALEGSMQSLNNYGYGLLIDKSSAFAVRESGMLTVSGTSGGLGTGILISAASALRVNGGLLVENTAGQYGKGIDVIRSSSLALQGSSLDAKIRNNQAEGVFIGGNSSGRFDVGTEIYGNTTEGINASSNSNIGATNISVHDNGRNGIKALWGSFIVVKDSSIINNTARDINLSLGAVSYMSGNTIGTITCDETVDSQGDFVCP